jgi:ketosteroid isomerase-like protein
VDNSSRIELVNEYFRRVDSGDPAMIDLFTEDAEMWFPKHGVAKGKAGIARFGSILGANLQRITHAIDEFRYHISGDVVVVEGTESGVTREGIRWPDGEVSQGRFCNVFDFEGALIRRLSIYVDPDFTSSHEERIRQLRP